MKWLLSLLLVCSLGLSANSPAAATTTNYTTDLSRTVIPASSDRGTLAPIMHLSSRHMQAGESVLLTARLAATSNATRMPRMAIRIDANPIASDTLPYWTYRSPWATTNHPGEAYGTDYISVRWLFVAPETDDYTFTTRAEATTYIEPVSETELTIVPDLTYMRAQTTQPGSKSFQDASESCVGDRPHPSPDAPACTDPNELRSVHKATLYPGANRPWTVVSDLELSREYGYTPGGDSVLDIRLYVWEKTTAGFTCKTHPTKDRKSVV